MSEPIGAEDDDDVVLEGQATNEGPRHLVLTVAETDAGERLDRHLATRIEDQSRAQLQLAIREGLVRINDVCVKDPGRRVRVDETIIVTLRRAAPAEPQGEAIPLSVVYEDEHLIVVDKPAGLVVHPAPGHATGTLVNALVAHCGDSLSGIGGVRRPGIVHRIDKDTSGLIVVAKSDVAHQGLASQFASHGVDGRLQRTYLAVVWGAPVRPVGTVDLPLTRSAANRTKIAVARGQAGRRAVTHFEVVETFSMVDAPARRGARGKPEVARAEPVATLLKLHLETGRTHQIRVHMAALGHPLLGDTVYGTGFQTRASRLTPSAATALAALGRQALHAALLGFEHPVDGRTLCFESPLPQDVASLTAALRAGSAG